MDQAAVDAAQTPNDMVEQACPVVLTAPAATPQAEQPIQQPDQGQKTECGYGRGQRRW